MAWSGFGGNTGDDADGDSDGGCDGCCDVDSDGGCDGDSDGDSDGGSDGGCDGGCDAESDGEFGAIVPSYICAVTPSNNVSADDIVIRQERSVSSSTRLRLKSLSERNRNGLGLNRIVDTNKWKLVSCGQRCK